MKQNLFKTMLLAVALLGATGGVNAQEVASTKNVDFEDGNVMFSLFDNRKANLAISHDEESNSNVLVHNCTTNTGVALSYLDFSDIVKGAANVKVSFDCKIPNTTAQMFISLSNASVHTGLTGGFKSKSQWGYGTKGSILTLGCNRGRVNGRNNENYFSVNSEAKAASTLELKASSLLGTWIHVSANVDNINNKVTYSISDRNNEVILPETTVEFNDVSTTKCSQIDIYTATGGQILIDNLQITPEYKEGVDLSDYTISFMGDNSVELLPSYTGTAVVGSEFSVPNLAKYVSKDGVYYGIDNIDAYTLNFTKDQKDETKTIDYSSDVYVTYFGEWENANISSTNNVRIFEDTSFSGCKGRTINRKGAYMDISFDILTPGEYKLLIPYYNNNSSSRSHKITFDDGEPESVTAKAYEKGTYEYTKHYEIGNHKVSITGDGNLTAAFDYLQVSKVVPNNVEATISSAKFATFSPVYNVIVPAEESGIKVYTAKVEGNQINLTQVEAGKVLKAGTGYVVAGEENSYEFALTKEAAEAIEGNDLKVATGEGLTATADTKYYVLTKRADGVGFGKVATGVNIPAGKCYIDLTATASKATFLSFGGEPTGISNMEAAKANTNEYFSLQGVKTMKPNKGIYIHNGKKVVIK